MASATPTNSIFEIPTIEPGIQYSDRMVSSLPNIDSIINSPIAEFNPILKITDVICDVMPPDELYFQFNPELKSISERWVTYFLIRKKFLILVRKICDDLLKNNLHRVGKLIVRMINNKFKFVLDEFENKSSPSKMFLSIIGGQFQKYVKSLIYNRMRLSPIESDKIQKINSKYMNSLYAISMLYLTIYPINWGDVKIQIEKNAKDLVDKLNIDSIKSQVYSDELVKVSKELVKVREAAAVERNILCSKINIADAKLKKLRSESKKAMNQSSASNEEDVTEEVFPTKTRGKRSLSSEPSKMSSKGRGKRSKEFDEESNDDELVYTLLELSKKESTLSVSYSSRGRV